MFSGKVGEVIYSARIKTDKLKADAKEAEATAKATSDTIADDMDKGTNKASQALNKMASVAKVATAVVGGAAVAAIGKFVIAGGITRALNIEDAQAKLRGLGHDAESVQTIMDNALKSVKGTSFGLGEAATTAAGAVAAGIKPGEKLEGVLKTVANSAALAGTDMGEMGAIFNKVATSNKAQMDVINQLQDRGIPVLQFVAKEMGVTAEKAAEMASDGKISFEIFERAMRKGVGSAAAEMGKTTRGSWANMQAALARIGEKIVSGPIANVRDSFGAMTSFIDTNANKIVGYATNIVGSLQLLATGDYKKGMFASWIEEDSKYINILFNLREGIMQVANAIKTFAVQAFEYLAPKLSSLWTTINTNVIPALIDLWKNVIEPLIPVIGTVLVGAIGAVIDIAKLMVDGFGFVYDKIKEGNPIIWGLIGIFGTLATAMAFNAIFTALTAGFAFLTTVTIPGVMASVGALAAVIASPIVFGAIVVGAALASLALVFDAANKAKNAINEAMAASDRERDTSVALMKSARARYDRGEISMDELRRQVGIYSRASGGPVSANQPYFVGENSDGSLNKTSELFIPKTSGNIVNSKNLQSMLGSSGSSEIQNNIGTIIVRNNADMDTLLSKLTGNQEIVSGGLVPRQSYGS